jgi:hypothetical protein
VHITPPVHYKQLDYQERETIAHGIENGLGMRATACLVVQASAISREIERNSGGSSYSCRYGRMARQLIGEDATMKKEYLVRVIYTGVENTLAATSAGPTGSPCRAAWRRNLTPHEQFYTRRIPNLGCFDEFGGARAGPAAPA